MTTAEYHDGDSDLDRILILDALAQRYHKTPSEVWRDCDAFDYVVMTTAQGWEAAQRERANKAQGNQGQRVAPDIPQATLEAMLQRVKNK